MNGITSITVLQLTYPAVSAGQPATSNRLWELVTFNAGHALNWAWPIVITPLFGGTDPYTGVQVTGDSNNGHTYVDMGVTPHVIHVVYDTSQNGGTGIACFDTGVIRYPLRMRSYFITSFRTPSASPRINFHRQIHSAVPAPIRTSRRRRPTKT